MSREVSQLLTIGARPLTWRDVTAYARDTTRHRVDISKRASEAIKSSRTELLAFLSTPEGRLYGTTTGVGALVDIDVNSESQSVFQRRLVMSHAVGAKEPLDDEVSRTVILLRLNCFARGASAVGWPVIESLLRLANTDIAPVLPRAGSLGASGDLAPLAHLAAFLLGEGWGRKDGRRLPARDLLASERIEPLVLGPKDGLALINGTSALSAAGLLAVADLAGALEAGLVAIALAFCAFDVSSSFLHSAAYELKPHPGAQFCAAYLRRLLADRRCSDAAPASAQSVYSLRCAPFILGPSVTSIRSAMDALEIEINSVNDNPLWLQGLGPYHGGHFHGQCISVALDQLRVAIVHVSGVLDRQLEHLLDLRRGKARTPFLAVDPRLGHCGLEGAQYLVTSLHAENRYLSAPWSTTTCPTNSGNQDYVSLGLQSALACREMATNLRLQIAVHFLASMQALTLCGRSLVTKNLEGVRTLLQAHVPLPYRDDSPLSELVTPISDSRVLDACVLAARDSSPSLPHVLP